MWIVSGEEDHCHRRPHNNRLPTGASAIENEFCICAWRQIDSFFFYDGMGFKDYVRTIYRDDDGVFVI